jgi:hypothetical protein
MQQGLVADAGAERAEVENVHALMRNLALAEPPWDPESRDASQVSPGRHRTLPLHALEEVARQAL